MKKEEKNEGIEHMLELPPEVLHQMQLASACANQTAKVIETLKSKLLRVKERKQR